MAARSEPKLMRFLYESGGVNFRKCAMLNPALAPAETPTSALILKTAVKHTKTKQKIRRIVKFDTNIP